MARGVGVGVDGEAIGAGYKAYGGYFAGFAVGAKVRSSRWGCENGTRNLLLPINVFYFWCVLALRYRWRLAPMKNQEDIQRVEKWTGRG